MQESGRSPKVAVLDTIHGAGTIAQRMVEGGIFAEALEVYHHEPSVLDFDLVAAPVHLPLSNPVLAEARRLGKKIITHHQAVGELMASSVRPGLEIFEVTGTHSKTSTTLLLAKMLSAQKLVLTHTTRGLELWSSDGTGAGTSIVRDIYAGTSSSNPTNLTACGSGLFLTATDATHPVPRVRSVSWV